MSNSRKQRRKGDVKSELMYNYDTNKSVVFLTIAIKIIAVRIIKTLDSYLNKYDAQIMDLIRWAKGLDKHR